MRQIVVKYEGVCAKCGATLEVGQPAIYEKTTGIFCMGCEPTEVEEIRQYRQVKADVKADKYDSWAAKREKDATARLNTLPEVRHDWAFITQPGHIPLRARMNKSDDIAYESLGKASEMRQKAESLRNVSVKEDAERRRQAEREAQDKVIGKGSRVRDFMFGEGTVVGVYKKSYRVRFAESGSTYARDKTFVRLVQEEVTP